MEPCDVQDFISYPSSTFCTLESTLLDYSDHRDFTQIFAPITWAIFFEN